MKQKFKAGAHVCFKHSMFSPSVYWTVVNPNPDTIGQIVVKNRLGEYTIVRQDNVRKV